MLRRSIKVATTSSSSTMLQNRLPLTIIRNYRSSISTKNNVSQKNFDVKINAINQHISKLSSDVVKTNTLLGVQNSLLESQLKLKQLEIAIARTHIQKFTYYMGDSGDSDYAQESTELVKDILDYFMFDYGYKLSDTAYVEKMDHYDSEEDDGKLQFRTNIKDQIEFLIGREPNLVENSDGYYSIFYE